MASYRIFLVLALAAVAISMAVAQLLPANVASVDVLGRIVCSATGNAVPGVTTPGIPGVSVLVTCNGGTIDLGTIVTNTTGFFDGVLRTVDGVLFDPSTCVAQVTLPIVDCTVLPPTGVLHSVLGVGGLLDTLLGAVLQLVAGTWTIVAV